MLTHCNSTLYHDTLRIRRNPKREVSYHFPFLGVPIDTIRGAVLLVAFAFPALAAPPPGTDLNSPTHQWFEAQHSVAGAWCCNISDGHLLDDTDWRQAPDHYEVRIGSQWYPIPDTAMRDPRGGPNPTGKAIVWYIAGEAGVRIYCFAPGFEG